MAQMNTFGGADGSERRIKRAHKPSSLSHLNKAIILYQLYEVTSQYSVNTNPNKSSCKKYVIIMQKYLKSD
jgi:uncharacterized Fe-S cluster-containing protein